MATSLHKSNLSSRYSLSRLKLLSSAGCDHEPVLQGHVAFYLLQLPFSNTVGHTEFSGELLSSVAGKSRQKNIPVVMAISCHAVGIDAPKSMSSSAEMSNKNWRTQQCFRGGGSELPSLGSSGERE